MSEFEWTRLQKIQELELLRKYRFRPETLPLLFSYLRVREGSYVADVGCGAGVFCRILAKAVGPKGKVVGLDLDGTLLQTAREESKSDGRQEDIAFLRGSAYSLPLGDDTMDVALSISVLQHLRDPYRALREMRRIVKPGGCVAIVEGVGTLPAGQQEIDILPHPAFREDDRLLALVDTIDKAWLRDIYPAIADELGVAVGTASRAKTYAALFARAQLADYAVNGILSVFSLADHRHPADEAKDFLRKYFDYLENLIVSEFHDVVAANGGNSGLDEQDLEETVRLINTKRDFLIKDFDVVRDGFSWTATAFLICTGRKVIQ